MTTESRENLQAAISLSCFIVAMAFVACGREQPSKMERAHRDYQPLIAVTGESDKYKGGASTRSSDQAKEVVDGRTRITPIPKTAAGAQSDLSTSGLREPAAVEQHAKGVTDGGPGSAGGIGQAPHADDRRAGEDRGRVGDGGVVRAADADGSDRRVDQRAASPVRRVPEGQQQMSNGGAPWLTIPDEMPMPMGANATTAVASASALTAGTRSFVAAASPFRAMGTSVAAAPQGFTATDRTADRRVIEEIDPWLPPTTQTSEPQSTRALVSIANAASPSTAPMRSASIASSESTATLADCLGGHTFLPSEIDAEWLANTLTGQRWLTSIRAHYPPEIGDAYEPSLRCGAYFIKGWRDEIRVTGDPTVNPLEYLCRFGMPSPLWMAPYEVSGDRAAAERAIGPDFHGRLIGIFVTYNGREKWQDVIDDGCQVKCTYRFWYPCEPIWPGYEPVITGWQFSLVPWRIRPSGKGE